MLTVSSVWAKWCHETPSALSIVLVIFLSMLSGLASFLTVAQPHVQNDLMSLLGFGPLSGLFILWLLASGRRTVTWLGWGAVAWIFGMSFLPIGIAAMFGLSLR